MSDAGYENENNVFINYELHVPVPVSPLENIKFEAFHDNFII